MLFDIADSGRSPPGSVSQAYGKEISARNAYRLNLTPAMVFFHDGSERPISAALYRLNFLHLRCILQACSWLAVINAFF
jgi:hypothetical protein